MSRSVCVYHSRGPVRSLPGEAILPQRECRARCVLWTLYHKAGRKGSAARGKRKKICLFRQMGLYIPCGGISALSGFPMASHLPQRERRVSPSCRGVAGLFHVNHAWLALSCGRERVLALSGLPWASHLPQRRRRVFPPCLGFAGLFHVKHARLVLSRERERVPALSGLPWASHLPQRGRQVSPSCRGVTGLFHVKRKRQRSFRLAASPVGNE